MKLTEYLTELTDTEIQTFKAHCDLLTHKSGNYQFLINVESEHRLDRQVWVDFVAAVIGAGPDLAGIRTAVATVFQSYILSGGTIQPPLPSLYGRAVDKKRFYSHMVKMGYASSPRHAAQFLAGLKNKPLPVIRQRFDQKLLAAYTIWATFCENDPSEDPFRDVPKSRADDVRACMGLCLNAKDDLLLMVYSLPPGVNPLFPTVADAYAGNWNWYFRPVSIGSPYGRTLAWVHHPGAFNCPEVIHNRITGATMEAEIRSVRGI